MICKNFTEDLWAREHRVVLQMSTFSELHQYVDLAINILKLCRCLQLSSTPNRRVMMSYQAACWRLWQTAKTGPAHLCQGRPVAQGGIYRVYTHPRSLWNHTQTLIKLMHAHTYSYFIYSYTLNQIIHGKWHSSTHTLSLHCTSLLLCLGQSGGTRGTKYNCSNAVSPGPKWPTLDLREDGSQNLRRHQDIPINLRTLVYLYIYLLAGDVSWF